MRAVCCETAAWLMPRAPAAALMVPVSQTVRNVSSALVVNSVEKTPALPVTMLILQTVAVERQDAPRPVRAHPGILLAATVHGNRRRRNPVLMARMTLETKR